jgi:hypothetical protein
VCSIGYFWAKNTDFWWKYAKLLPVNGSVLNHQYPLFAPKCNFKVTIFLRHSSVLRRIWLNLMALCFGFHPTALSHFSLFFGFPTFLTWASLKRLEYSKCASGASRLVTN